MRGTLIFSLLATLAVRGAVAVPVLLDAQDAVVDAGSKAKAAEVTSTTTTFAARPTPTQLEKEERIADDEYGIRPPPIFDPPEARPETIFHSSDVQDIPPPPPIPASRMETLSPFDGAHVHPEHTPYPPDWEYRGVFASWWCRSLWVVASLSLLVIAVYCAVTLVERAAFCCVKVARSRRLTVGARPTGTIVLDEKRPSLSASVMAANRERESTRMGRSQSASFSSVFGRSSSPPKLNVV